MSIQRSIVESLASVNESYGEDEFYVEVSRGDDTGIIRVSKSDDKWYEEFVDGDVYGEPTSYMGYLSKSDILSWLRQDYDRARIVSYEESLGPVLEDGDTDKVVHEYRSPLYLVIISENDYGMSDGSIVTAEEYPDAAQAIIEEFDSIDLANYLDDDLKDLVTNIVLDLSGNPSNRIIYTTYKVEFTREPTKDEEDKLLDYLSGQMSDGFGEGLEQRNLYTYSVDEDREEWDEDEQEIYYEEVEVTYNIECRPWWGESSPVAWSITKIK